MKRIKYETFDNLAAIFSGLLLFLILFVMPAYAGGKDHHKPSWPSKQVTNNVDRHNEAKSNATSESVSGAMADSNASNDLTVEGDTVENNSSNIVLVPNNNTESCIRVWGIAWGESGKSGALGVPWRSKACDLEQAADDAFAAGERELGWFWKCQSKNLYKVFMRDGIHKDEAKYLCHQKAVGEISNQQTITRLRKDLDFLQLEREIDREKCNQSKDRIADACFKK